VRKKDTRRSLPNEPKAEITEQYWQFIIAEYRMNREYRGTSTVNELNLLIKLLNNEAQLLYSTENRLEHDPDAVIVHERPITSFRVTLKRYRLKHSFFARRAMELIEERAAGFLEPKICIEFRRLAKVFMDAAERERVLLDAYLKTVQFLREGKVCGRYPSTSMYVLLKRTKLMGIGDAALARRLTDEALIPEGPGSNSYLEERWRAVLKSARARRRPR
jgi:hypothetical protein